MSKGQAHRRYYELQAEKENITNSYNYTVQSMIGEHLDDLPDEVYERVKEIVDEQADIVRYLRPHLKDVIFLDPYRR